jgi:hypothetical protein
MVIVILGLIDVKVGKKGENPEKQSRNFKHPVS